MSKLPEGQALDYFKERGITPSFLSGGKLENPQKEWAIVLFGGSKVHYFEREQSEEFKELLVSRCGVIAHESQMYGGGNYPKCKRCVRMVVGKVL